MAYRFTDHLKADGSRTAKAWLAGWDAGIVNNHACGYIRDPQVRAYDRGFKAAQRSSANDVRACKVMMARTGHSAAAWFTDAELGRG